VLLNGAARLCNNATPRGQRQIYEAISKLEHNQFGMNEVESLKKTKLLG
jgi:hypothetical protein